MSVPLVSSYFNPLDGTQCSSHIFRRAKSHLFFLDNGFPTIKTKNCRSDSSSLYQFFHSHQHFYAPIHAMSSKNDGSRTTPSSSFPSSSSNSTSESEDFSERNVTDAEIDSDADDEPRMVIPFQEYGKDYDPSSLPEKWDVLGLGQAMVSATRISQLLTVINPFLA